MQIAKDLAGFTPAEADDLRKAISKKVRALMASLREKFLAGCEANGVARARRGVALGGERAQRRLLVQQGARGLLRDDRLPHGLPQGEPSRAVHGGADLVRHADQGQGAVLRQRLRRDGHRGAAARRQQLGRGLHGRRRPHPLRPDGGQGRGRGRGARDRAGARATAARSRRCGTSASAWTPQQINKRVLESLVKCGGLDSTGATRGAMLAALEAAAAAGQKTQADALARPGLDLRPRRQRRGASRSATIRRWSGPSSSKQELLAFEKETLGLYLTDHPLAEVRRSAAPPRRPAAARPAEPPRARDGLGRRPDRLAARDDLAQRRADGVRAPRRRHDAGRGRRLRQGLRRLPRAPRRGRDRDRQGPRRPPRRGRDEAARDRDRAVRGRAGPRRGARCASTAASPAGVRRASWRADQRVPGRGQRRHGGRAPTRASASCASARPTRCGPRRTSSARCACSAARPSSSEPCAARLRRRARSRQLGEFAAGASGLVATMQA